MTRSTTVVETDRKIDDDLSEVLSSIQSSFGDDSITFLEGASGLWPLDRRIRTGSLDLDLALGIGGWPRGRINCVYGEESSGKTTIALHAIAEAQRSGLLCAYIDAENALDPGYMRDLGIDTSKVLISQTPQLEQAIDTMVALMNTGKVDLLIADSIPALKSKIVLESDAETETRALEARRWAAQMPRVVRAAKESNTCVIMINQVRDSMDIYKPESLPGGRTLKFAFSTMVQLRKHQEGKGNADGLDYHEARFKITKNKVGSPFKGGSFYLVPGSPIDWVEDVMLVGIKKDLILADVKTVDGDQQNKKGWFTIPLRPGDRELILKDEPDFDVDEDALVVYRQGALLERLKQVPTFVEVLEERVLQTLNNGTSLVSGESEQDLSYLEDADPAESDDED